VAEQFADEPVSLVLCDPNGVMLTRDTGDSALRTQLDRVWLAPGFSYAERHVGTNGIGTALEAGAPARVFGHEYPGCSVTSTTWSTWRTSPAPRCPCGTR
jgi:transcriptional regulator of acetoin/glycerol metabolism